MQHTSANSLAAESLPAPSSGGKVRKTPPLQQQAASDTLRIVQKPNFQLPDRAASLPRPTQKEIQRCNIPEVISGSQCFQAWLDLFHKGLCVRNRMKQFLIFLVGLDCNIKQIAAHKFDTTEVPADPAKITNHFFKLLLTFFQSATRYASGLFFAIQNTYSSGSSLKIFSTSWQSWLQSCRNSRSARRPSSVTM